VRACRGNNWFLHTKPAPVGIRNVSKRLEQLTPFVAIECAGIGALVDRGGERPKFPSMDGMLRLKVIMFLLLRHFAILVRVWDFLDLRIVSI
jgi:hypothetical protein